jgi:hypothetical protein
VNPRSSVWRRWSPRILGLIFCVFLVQFARDASGRSDALRHLAPVALLVGLMVLAWQRPGIGGVAFLGLAAAYAVSARAHPSWIAAIAGPLALIGTLFLASGSRQPAPGHVELR